jgi:lambda family phage portal protein
MTKRGYLSIVDHRGQPIPVAAVEGAYEGAASGRRMGTWGTSGAGPGAALFSNLSTLRSRSRQLIRNNPLVDGGADSYVANIIGSGINPRWQLEDTALKEEIQELWDDWTEEADFYESLDFYGLQSLVCRGLIDAGEMLSRHVYRRPEDGLSVPLQVQLLEADHLDHTFNSVADNGNEIRMGIEIDAEGKRTAYHLWAEHPGEAFIMNRNPGERRRIPANQVRHVFKPLRAGQMRGRPWLASIIVKLHELDQYDDAELVRKKTAAMFGGFITETVSSNDPTTFFGTRKADDGEGRDVVAFEPGTFPVLPRGMDVKFSEPADVGQTFEVWIKQQLRQIAKGMGITYEQLTGDLAGVNYSSIRDGLLEFRRRVEQLQREILIFQFCRPTAHAWLDAAVQSGTLRIPDYFKNRRIYRRIKWRPDGWPWVDPVKDQLAEKMAVRSGFKSRSQVIAGQGGDIETVDRETAEDNARADRLGLIYDTDPRKITPKGATATSGNQNESSSAGDEK